MIGTMQRVKQHLVLVQSAWSESGGVACFLCGIRVGCVGRLDRSANAIRLANGQRLDREPGVYRESLVSVAVAHGRKRSNEGQARKLAALIGIHDLGFAVFADGLFECIQTKLASIVIVIRCARTRLENPSITTVR